MYEFHPGTTRTVSVLWIRVLEYSSTMVPGYSIQWTRNDEKSIGESRARSIALGELEDLSSCMAMPKPGKDLAIVTMIK